MHGLEERDSDLEQLFDGCYLVLVSQKQDHVVFSLNHYVIMSDDDLFATNQRADAGSGG